MQATQRYEDVFNITEATAILLHVATLCSKMLNGSNRQSSNNVTKLSDNIDEHAWTTHRPQ
jgi:hypothetical protein